MATEGRTRVHTPNEGDVRCLRCHKPFKSPDRTRVRICTKCKRTPGERCGLIGEQVSDVLGLDDRELDG